MEDDLLSEPDNESEGEPHPLIEQENNPATNDSGVHLLQDGASFTLLTHDHDVSIDHRSVKQKRPYFVWIEVRA
jgi:hypothetical protein